MKRQDSGSVFIRGYVMNGGKLIDGEIVRESSAFEAPLLTKDLFEKPRIRTGRNTAIILVIGRHYRCHMRLCRFPKRRQKHLAHRSFRDVIRPHVGAVLRLPMYKMFCDSEHMVAVQRF